MASGTAFEHFLWSLVQQESSGNYGASNANNGDRAEGAYEILDSNIPSWSKAALGYSITPSQFMNGYTHNGTAVSAKTAQDEIAQYELKKYWNSAPPGSTDDERVLWASHKWNPAANTGTYGGMILDRIKANPTKWIPDVTGGGADGVAPVDDIPTPPYPHSVSKDWAQKSDPHWMQPAMRIAVCKWLLAVIASKRTDDNAVKAKAWIAKAGKDAPKIWAACIAANGAPGIEKMRDDDTGTTYDGSVNYIEKGNASGATDDPLAPIKTIFEWFGNGANWVRVGEAALGITLVTIAFVFTFKKQLAGVAKVLPAGKTIAVATAPKAASKPEAKPEAKPEVKPEVKPEATKPEAKPEEVKS